MLYIAFSQRRGGEFRNIDITTIIRLYNRFNVLRGFHKTFYKIQNNNTIISSTLKIARLVRLDVVTHKTDFHRQNEKKNVIYNVVFGTGIETHVKTVENFSA